MEQQIFEIFNVGLAHASQSLWPVLACLALGVPAGWAASRIAPLSRICKEAQEILYALPLFGVFALGWGLMAADLTLGLALMFALYGFLPIACHTAGGIRGVDASVVDACRGMGLSEGRIFMLVWLPQTAPHVLEGLRRAWLASVTILALAAFLRPAGLGAYVARGFTSGETVPAMAGGLGLCLLALAVDRALVLARWLLSRHHPQPLTADGGMLNF